MLPAASVATNVGSQAVAKSQETQRTPIKTIRTHRIFNQNSPPREAVRSRQKLVESEATQLNSTRYRSPQSCNAYYKQEYGLVRPSAHTAISPQKLTLIKSNEILEYENALLLQQLQSRDDVIKMYKSGYSPHSTPINDSVIKQLNLRLSQKNVLIEQIHRNLVQFSQRVAKQKIEISPICAERMKIMLDLIEEHEHYPIIIRERIADTCKPAQPIPIRQEISPDWQIKMQKSYAELVTIKQRLEWFERQNSVLQSTMAGLKMQRQTNTNQDPAHYKIQLQKLNNELIMMQQQASNYKYQINNLTQTIAQLHKNINQPAPVANTAEISRLRQEIKKYQQKVLELWEKDKEIIVLKEIIERYKNQIVVFRGKEVKIDTENMQMKAVIDELRSKLDGKGMERDKTIKTDQITYQYELRIGELDKQLQFSNLKINELQKQNKICSEQAKKWRKHLQQAEDYIEKLLNQIQNNKKTQQPQSQQTNRLTLQITNLLQNIQNLRAECNHLKQQQNRMYLTSQQYKMQIKEYTGRIQNLVRERDGQVRKWQDVLNKKNAEYNTNLQQIQIRVRKQSEGLIIELKKQIQNLRNTKTIQDNRIKIQYQDKLTKQKLQIQNYLKQIHILKQNKSNWQRQVSIMRQDYDRKFKQVWGKLAKAEDYIFTMQQKTRSQISSLKSSLSQIQFENQNLKKNNQKDKDQYKYKVDSRYSEVQSKLLALSHKNAHNLTKQAQFWQQYHLQRKKDLQEVSAIINDSLNIIGNVDQAVIIRRDELYRLDLTKLEDILKQISKFNQNKQQLSNSIRQNVESKFYGLLRTVSTQFTQ